MRVAIAQLNPTIGDFGGNLAKIASAYERACGRRAELVVVPELMLPGYPPKDLLEEPAFIQANLRALADLASRIGSVPIIVGFVDHDPKAPVGRRIYNAAALLEAGRVRSVHRKALLPTYDVFDEHRYFEPSTEFRLAEAAGR